MIALFKNVILAYVYICVYPKNVEKKTWKYSI